eukprot:7774991-Alexandrium_andersonii.AAC.1
MHRLDVANGRCARLFRETGSPFAEAERTWRRVPSGRAPPQGPQLDASGAASPTSTAAGYAVGASRSTPPTAADADAQLRALRPLCWDRTAEASRRPFTELEDEELVGAMRRAGFSGGSDDPEEWGDVLGPPREGTPPQAPQLVVSSSVLAPAPG